MSDLRLPPLSLYIHIPWCERKCPYCDFNSHTAPGTLPECDYVTALLADLDADLGFVQSRSLTSIFIGGGTPSLLSVPALSDLLDGIRSRVGIEPDCEITLEANPGSAEAGKFAGFVGAGVNRLSLGVQSFDDRRLALLGRVHNGEQAMVAVGLARDAGIRNLNLDLMHGLPGQRVSEAGDDLELAVALAPEHLSWYQLTIERNTAFWRRPPELPGESGLAGIQAKGETILAHAGYEIYEVSAYARAGYRCRHNLNYWQFGDYLGIGAGAHGKVTRLAENDVIRTAKWQQPETYLAGREGGYRARLEAVPADQRVGDFMLNALRLSEGFELTQFRNRTGLFDQVIESRLESLQARGLLVEEGGRIRATALGRRYLDDVVAAFI